jgi:hypothetical protein
MMDDTMFQLVNLSTGQIIAPLSAAHVRALTSYLEQESLTDTNFYIAPETIEFLRDQGADELARLLATALGTASGIEVGYAPMHQTGSGHVRGRLLALENQTALTGYKIEAYDEDLTTDDLLGWCYADAQGTFELYFDEAAFKDTTLLDLEGEPEVKLHILTVEGEEVGWIGMVRARDVDFGDIFVSATGQPIAPVLEPNAAAICPRCGALYRAGFPTCSDCQVPVRPLASSREP